MNIWRNAKKMSVKEVILEEQRTYIKIVKDKQQDFDELIIYGAGIYGRDLNSFLLRNGIFVDGFCVTDMMFNASSVQNLPVWDLASYRCHGKKALFLIAITEPMNREIIKTLEEMGFHDYIDAPAYIDAIIDEAFFRPVLEITPHAGCSVNCRYCPQKLFLSRYFSATRQKDMTLDEFKLCIDKTPEDLIVDFSGFVEPFLNPETGKMIFYAAQKRRDIRLYTTLVGLTMEEFRRIERIPFMRVVVHVPDVKSYANIPLTEDYFALLEYAANCRKPNGDAFIDKVSCQSEPHPRTAAILQGKVAASWNLIDRAGNLSGDVLDSRFSDSGEIYCSRAANLNHNVLLPNGDVVLCCMDYGMRHVLGNLYRESYEHIINGTEAQNVKNSLLSTNESLCRKCTAARNLEAI